MSGPAGAAVFCCKSTQQLGQLSGAPRAVLHGALTEPYLFLDRACTTSNIGVHAGMPDSCLAFQLFDQVGGGRWSGREGLCWTRGVQGWPGAQTGGI